MGGGHHGSRNFCKMSLSLFAIAAIVGCSGGHDPSNEPAEEPEKIGFEIIEFGSPPSPPFRAWVTPEITRQEFEALELPPGWRKNQPREGDPDSSIFTRSREGDAYFRIGRDADRTSDQPTIPNLWRLVEYTTPEAFVIQLFGGNTVIRTDNEDSFQGPVPELAAVLP